MSDMFKELLNDLNKEQCEQPAFETCYDMEDFTESNYDVDSIHVIGKGNLSWLKPIMNFFCPLKSINAIPCYDKKLTNQLIHKINYQDTLKCGLNTALTRPEIRYRKEVASWITFDLGASGLETVRVYALILNEKDGKYNEIVKTYRKIFFENYILKSLNAILSKATDENSLFSHTSMTNAKKKIPSDGLLRLYPDSWLQFTKQVDHYLKLQLPPCTLGIFFGLTVHGIKSEWNLMAENLSKRIENLINFDEASQIALMQIHLAVTLKCTDQLVIGDKSKLTEIAKTQDFNVYEKFCLNKDLVYFTINRLKDSRFSLVSYTQFYPENWHVLMKESYGTRACFFLNAALGLNGVGALGVDDLKENKNLPNLNDHIKRITCWCRKLRSCMLSIRSGTVGRLESVFTVKDFDLNKMRNDTSSENSDLSVHKFFQSSMHHFNEVVDYVIKNGVIIKSTGIWWRKYVDVVNECLVEPLIGQVTLRPQISLITLKPEENPLTLMELKRIYDLEQLLMIWIDETGRGYKPINYDSARVNKIFEFLKKTKDGKMNFGASSNHNSIVKICKKRKKISHSIEKVTDLMSILEVTRDDPDNLCYLVKYLTRAIETFESNEKSNFAWFESRTITVRGYLPCLAKYCYYMIYCAPRDSVQRDQLSLYPTLNLMCCLESCVAKNWDIEVKENESVFSRETFKRTLWKQKITKVWRLGLDPRVFTSQQVLKAILKPSTVFGKTIINRTFGTEGSENLRENDCFELLEFIQKRVKVFPKFLVNNDKENYYKWQVVEDEIKA